jgi:hypothetical protein
MERQKMTSIKVLLFKIHPTPSIVSGSGVQIASYPNEMQRIFLQYIFLFELKK